MQVVAVNDDGIMLAATKPIEQLKAEGADAKTIRTCEAFLAERERVIGLAPTSLDGLPRIGPDEVGNPVYWLNVVREHSGKAVALDGAAWNDLIESLLPEDGDEEMGGGFNLKHHIQPAQGFASLAANDEELRHLARFGLAVGRYIPLFTHDDSSDWVGVCPDEDILIPVLRQRKQNISSDHPEPYEVWMSLTPMEFATCGTSIGPAEGNVLMGGLGLGWMARKMAEKPEVEKVTVIERHPDIARIFDPKHPKIEVVVGDANSLGLELYLKYDYLAWDIWPNYSQAHRDKDWQLLKQKAEKAGIKTWQWARKLHTTKPDFPELWWWAIDASGFLALEV